MGKIILVFVMCLVVGTPKDVLSDTSMLDETEKWFDGLLEEIKNEVESVKEKADVYDQQIRKSIEDYTSETTESLNTEVENKMKIMIKILNEFSRYDTEKCSLIAVSLRANMSRTRETLEINKNRQISVTNNLMGEVEKRCNELIAQIDGAKKDRSNCISTDLQKTPANIEPSECISSVGFNLFDKTTKSVFFINFEKFNYFKRVAKKRLIKDTTTTIRILKKQIRTLFDKIKPCIRERDPGADDALFRVLWGI